jgi:hypothetical protein
MRYHLLLLSVAACTTRHPGDDTDTSTTSTTTNTTGPSSSTTGAPTTSATTDDPSTGAPVECLEAKYSGSDPPDAWMLTCDLPALCTGDDPLLFQIEGPGFDNPELVEISDVARARCVAEALRDRLPGHVDLVITSGPDVLYWPLAYEIVGDIGVLHLFRTYTNPSLPAPPNVFESLHLLREPEFFAACADGDNDALWNCLKAPFASECLPGPLTCPD